LGAFTKYPCTSYFHKRDRKKRSQKKFGFFESELIHFREIANTLGLVAVDELCWSRHPLSFLVEAADDICYSIIDLEDGCRLGLISFDETVALLSGILGDKLNHTKLRRITGLNEQLGVLRAITISVITEDCTHVFLDNEKLILNGQFDTALTEAGKFSKELETIGDISINKIYQSRAVTEIEAAGFEALPGLMEDFIMASLNLKFKDRPRKYSTIARLIPIEISVPIESSPDPYTMLRLVIDLVSGLTDKHALSLFRQIKGISS
jgi:dGTPase